MKILVISDSHGHIANLKTAIEIGKKANVKAIIHCGDWDNIQAVEAVLSFGIPLYTVLGNADISDDVKNRFPKVLEIKLDGLKIAVAHNVRDLELKNYDFGFCGHRHKQGKIGNVINPGALENSINLAIFDTKTLSVEFINEQI